MKVTDATSSSPSPSPTSSDVSKRPVDGAPEDNSIHDDAFPFVRHGYSEQVRQDDSFNISKTKQPANLFGLTDLPTYTPPLGSRVQTYSGHSKVVTVVTPPTFQSQKKKQTEFGEKISSINSPSRTTASLNTDMFSASPGSTVTGDLRRLQAEPESYLWHFPELLADGEMLRGDDAAAVRDAVLELQKEKH